MGLDMSWMLGCSTLLRMNLVLQCPEPELMYFSDKVEELLSVLDLRIEALHKILRLILQLMKSHLIITAKILVDCMGVHTVFSLLSGNWSIFLHVSYAMAVDLQGISLTSSLRSNVLKEAYPLLN